MVSLVALPIKPTPPLPSPSVLSSMSSTGSLILAVEHHYHLQSLFRPKSSVSCADGPHGRLTHRPPFLLAHAYSRRLRWLFVCRDTGFVLLRWAILSSDQEWRVWISSSVECPPQHNTPTWALLLFFLSFSPRAGGSLFENPMIRRQSNPAAHKGSVELGDLE
jgi:hypothetical protein